MCDLQFEIIDESFKRIEPTDPVGIRDEVRKRIYVVVVDPTIAIVDDVFDTADVDARRLNDRLHCSDDLCGRCVSLYA
jgi:hypothetical protein